MSREQPIEITRALADRLACKVRFDDQKTVRDQVDYLTGSEIAGWRLDKLVGWVIEAHGETARAERE
jgi:hypothetical protein